MSLWAELKRRDVFRVAAAYLIASWLIVQVADQLTGPLNLPDSFTTIVVVLLAIGFPIALIIAWIYDVTPDGVRATRSGETNVNPLSAQRLNYVIVALLVAAVGLMAVDTFDLSDSTDSSRIVAATEDVPLSLTDEDASPNTADGGGENVADAGEPALEPITLAVFPFDDGSQTEDQAYLAAGIAGEIRSSLSLVDGLNVVGDATSPLFKEQYSDLRSLRADWGVDYVLAGNVLSSGNQLRIRVELTNTETAEIAYANGYERTIDDSFEMIDEISATVARAMEITLGVGPAGTRLGGTRNARAFEAYLEAVSHSPILIQELRASIAGLERAVAYDEDFSLAWFELWLRSTGLDQFLQGQGGDAAALRRADEAMNRVTELTPGLPELLLADVLSGNSGLEVFEASRRFDEFSRVAAESGYPPSEIQLTQALFLFGVGRIGEAIALAERARAIDPLNFFPTVVLTEGYAAQGRSEESLELAREYAQQVGRFVVELAGRVPYTALESGDEEIIARAFARFDSAAGESGLNGLIYRMGQLLDAPERALTDLEASYRSGELGPFGAMHAALWAAYFGDTEFALEILKDANGQPIVMNVPRPIFAAVRRTEDFKAFVRELGLVAYWRESGAWADYCRPVGLNDFECF